MKQLLDKIKNGLKIEDKESPFFGKDEEGNDLFYPWGKPGEALCVSKREAKKINGIINTLMGSVVFACFVFLVGSVKGWIGLFAGAYFISTIIIASSLAYCFVTFRLFKNKKVQNQPKKQRSKKSVTFLSNIGFVPTLTFLSLILDLSGSGYALMFLAAIHFVFLILLLTFGLMLKESWGFFFTDFLQKKG